MTRFQIRHDLQCSPEHFWTLFFDPAFTRKMIVEGLGFHECDLGQIRDEGNEQHRSMTVTPKLDLPAAVTKVIGSSLSYREDGVFNKDTKTWSWVTKLAVMGERIRLGGSMRIEPGASPEQCVRVTDLWVDVKIFGVAGLIEKAAERSLRAGWGESATWLNGYLRDHPPT